MKRYVVPFSIRVWPCWYPPWTGRHGFCRTPRFRTSVFHRMFRQMAAVCSDPPVFCCLAVAGIMRSFVAAQFWGWLQIPRLFLDGKPWRGVHDAVTPEEIIRVASMTSVSSNPSLALAFQEEVMAVRKRCSLTGLWELFAASLATGCSVQSVHPSMGCPLYRLHSNQIIRAPGVSQDHKLFIMWTTNHDDGAVGGKLDPEPLLFRL